MADEQILDDQRFDDLERAKPFILCEIQKNGPIPDDPVDAYLRGIDLGGILVIIFGGGLWPLRDTGRV